MLDITDAVYVPVNINIAISGIQGRSRFHRSHFYARRFFDGAKFVAHIVHDTAAMQSQQIGRLTGIETNHRPYGTSIPYFLSIFIDNGKVTVGKEAVYIFHPSLDREILVLIRHLVQLDSQTRQHPRIIILIQGCDTETAFRSMKPCTVQQMVTKHTHCQAPGKVHMKRFRNKPISSYFVILTHYSCCSLLRRYFASRSAKYSFTRSKQLVVIATRPERTNWSTHSNARSSS